MEATRPKKLLIRRKDIMEWLGWSESQFNRAKKRGWVNPIVMNNKKTTLYNRDIIRHEILGEKIDFEIDDKVKKTVLKDCEEGHSSFL